MSNQLSVRGTRPPSEYRKRSSSHPPTAKTNALVSRIRPQSGYVRSFTIIKTQNVSFEDVVFSCFRELKEEIQKKENKILSLQRIVDQDQTAIMDLRERLESIIQEREWYKKVSSRDGSPERSSRIWHFYRSDVSDEEILRRASGVRMVILDVDGTILDPIVSFDSPSGKVMVDDGFGLIRLREFLPFIQVCFLSGGAAKEKFTHHAVQKWRIPVENIFFNVPNKKEALLELLRRKELQASQVAYMGDDVNDKEALSHIKEAGGLAACPAGSNLEFSFFTSTERGGHGAVRALVELILAGYQCATAICLKRSDAGGAPPQ